MTVSWGKILQVLKTAVAAVSNAPPHISLLNFSQKASRYATRRQINFAHDSIAACKLQKLNFSQSQNNCWRTDWCQEWNKKASLLKSVNKHVTLLFDAYFPVRFRAQQQAKYNSLQLTANCIDARVKFGSGVIFLDKSNAFATHSNQWDCFICIDNRLRQIYFFRVCQSGQSAWQRPAFESC